MATKQKKTPISNELEQNVSKVIVQDLVIPQKSLIRSLASPFTEIENALLKAPAAPNNLLGLCSIQDFSGVFGNHNADLGATHADARGFYTYLYNWYTANFWYGDGAVKTWLYEEPYDHWQNYYGVDAVCIFYHSGHGNMTSAGVFQAPMGGKWNNESWFTSDNKVLFGNQRIRYIFLSTCLSLRVLGGQSPVRTWWGDDNNPGFRMLFGFETTSIDSGDYGSNFWKHWKNGLPFSTAWLNASWDIYHQQAPSVVASGANQAEATNILFNERLFSWNSVARNWYQWRWYYAASVAGRNKNIPEQLRIAEFLPATFTQENAHKVAKDAGLENPVAGLSADGTYSITTENQLVSINERGHLNLHLAPINTKNQQRLNQSEAIRIAQNQISKFGLDAGEPFQFDLIRLGMTAGGNTKNREDIQEAYVTDTTVQFKQLINKVPVVNSNEGIIRITIDNDGTVTDIHSSVKKITSLSSLPKSTPIDPSQPDLNSLHGLQANLDHQFAEKIKHLPVSKLVAESEEVGYDLNYFHGRIVAKRVYEVEYPEGLKKLVEVLVSIFE